MKLPLTLEGAVHVRCCGKGGQRELRLGPEPVRPTRPAGRIPRVSRFKALALRFEEHLRTGHVHSYRELAR